MGSWAHLDMPFCRSGKGVRHKAEDLLELNDWPLTGDERRKSRVANLVLVVDLTGRTMVSCRVGARAGENVEAEVWMERSGGARKMVESVQTYHVVKERLDETLRGTGRPAALALVAADGVERIDGAGSIAVDPSDYRIDRQ